MHTEIVECVSVEFDVLEIVEDNFAVDLAIHAQNWVLTGGVALDRETILCALQVRAQRYNTPPLRHWSDLCLLLRLAAQTASEKSANRGNLDLRSAIYETHLLCN